MSSALSIRQLTKTYGAVTVCCSYSNIPDLYARTVHDHDPLRALAARHLFLFHLNPERLEHIARTHQCDAVVVVEQHLDGHPSMEARALEAAGIPYLALPRDGDDPEIRGLVSDFIERRLLEGAA